MIITQTGGIQHVWNLMCLRNYALTLMINLLGHDLISVLSHFKHF